MSSRPSFARARWSCSATFLSLFSGSSRCASTRIWRPPIFSARESRARRAWTWLSASFQPVNATQLRYHTEASRAGHGNDFTRQALRWALAAAALLPCFAHSPSISAAKGRTPPCWLRRSSGSSEAPRAMSSRRGSMPSSGCPANVAFASRRQRCLCSRQAFCSHWHRARKHSSGGRSLHLPSSFLESDAGAVARARRFSK